MDKIKPKKKMAMGKMMKGGVAKKKMMGGGMSKKPMAYKKGAMAKSRLAERMKDKDKVSQKDIARAGKMMGGGMSKRPMMMKGGVAEAARKIKNKK